MRESDLYIVASNPMWQGPYLLSVTVDIVDVSEPKPTPIRRVVTINPRDWRTATAGSAFDDALQELSDDDRRLVMDRVDRTVRNTVRDFGFSRPG